MAEPFGTIAKYRKMGQIEKHNEQVRAWAAPMALDVAAIFWATWRGIEKRMPEGDIETDEEKFRALTQINRIADEEISKQTPNLWACLAEYKRKVFLAGAVEQCRRVHNYNFLSAREPFREAATPEVVNISEADTIAVQADADGWVSLPNQRAVDYATTNAADMVTNIDETTRAEINDIIVRATQNGTSYSDIASEIKGKFSEFAVPKPQEHIENRATLVAVTELGNAYCAGNMEVGQHLEDAGLEMMKIWSTCEDDRVSDGCNENANAGWIPLDDEFPSGDQYPPRFPGCRCDILQDMLDEDALGKSYDEYMDMEAEGNFTYENPSKYEYGVQDLYDKNELYAEEKAAAKRRTSENVKDLWATAREDSRFFAGNDFMKSLRGDELGSDATYDEIFESALKNGKINQYDYDALMMTHGYTGTPDSFDINAYLRGETRSAIDPDIKFDSVSTKYFDKVVASMDNLISNENLAKNLECTRFYQEFPDSLKDELLGGNDTYIARGYTSATVAETHGFAEGAQCIAHITVQSGDAKGIYAQAIEDVLPSNYGCDEKGNVVPVGREYEYIIGRDTEFTIDKVDTTGAVPEVWLTTKN